MSARDLGAMPRDPSKFSRASFFNIAHLHFRFARQADEQGDRLSEIANP